MKQLGPQWVVGIAITIVLSVLGWSQWQKTIIINTIQETQREEERRTEQRINAVVERFLARLNRYEDKFVTCDVFEQHEKIHEMMEKEKEKTCDE